MRVVICDDHRLLAECLREAIEGAGHEVDALAASPAEAIVCVELKRPDVLLLDLGFPDGDSLAAARDLTASHPGTRIVVLTGSDSLEDARRALDAGVAGYLRKDERIDRIIDALERCASGERVVDGQLLRRLTRQPVRSTGFRDVNLLTPRERDVARLLQAGLNTAEMVEQLGIRESTVRRHVQAIFAKLSVHSRIEAVACLGDVPTHRAHAVAGS
jgi:two-component system, NarL family, nitrate/nitrite response regulator NarL